MTDAAIPTDVQEIPGPSRFHARGQSFELDLLDTIYTLHDIAEEDAKQGKSQREYLGHVIQFVQNTVGVTLTYGEADWLNDQLEIEYAQAKKKRRDAIASVLTSPSSTPSTPAE